MKQGSDFFDFISKGPRALILGKWMMKKLQWACTARGAQKCEKCHFAFKFLAKQQFFLSLESR